MTDEYVDGGLIPIANAATSNLYVDPYADVGHGRGAWYRFVSMDVVVVGDMAALREFVGPTSMHDHGWSLHHLLKGKLVEACPGVQAEGSRAGECTECRQVIDALRH